MRPTMRLRVWIWRHWIDGILAGRETRHWRWLCQALEFWDNYLNLLYRGPK